jgi:hypothetical protein
MRFREDAEQAAYCRQQAAACAAAAARAATTEVRQAYLELKQGWRSLSPKVEDADGVLAAATAADDACSQPPPTPTGNPAQKGARSSD